MNFVWIIIIIEIFKNLSDIEYRHIKKNGIEGGQSLIEGFNHLLITSKLVSILFMEAIIKKYVCADYNWEAKFSHINKYHIF